MERIHGRTRSYPFTKNFSWYGSEFVSYLVGIYVPAVRAYKGQTRARMHHKVVGNFRSEADVRSLYYRR